MENGLNIPSTTWKHNVTLYLMISLSRSSSPVREATLRPSMASELLMLNDWGFVRAKITVFSAPVCSISVRISINFWSFPPCLRQVQVWIIMLIWKKMAIFGKARLSVQILNLHNFTHHKLYDTVWDNFPKDEITLHILNSCTNS